MGNQNFISRDMQIVNKTLGKWVNNIHIEYNTVTSEGKNNLYRKYNGKWFEHKNTRLPSVFKKECIECEDPQIKIPTQVISTLDEYTIYNWIGHEKSGSIDKNTCLRVIVQSMDKVHQRILANTIFPQDDGEEILNSLNKEQLLTGSDGSVKDDRGACEFCIGDPRSVNCMKGSYICPSYSGDMSSLRAEAYGALGIVLLIKTIIISFKLNFFCF